MAELHHRVYVIKLDKTVLKERKFASANPNYKSKLPCVYVEQTGIPIEERFQNHKDGYKSSKIVFNYGIKLLPKLYENIPPMTYDESLKMEKKLSRKLRNKGYAVWYR